MAWLISLRDLQWRRRRFAIGVVATALVFALGLVLSGVRASFDNEIRRTVDSFDADAWFLKGGSLGPFTAPRPFPASRVAAVRRLQVQKWDRHSSPLASRTNSSKSRR